VSKVNKKAIKDLIERLPDDSVELADIRAVMDGVSLPFDGESKPPKMPQMKEKSTKGDKFNPMWLVEFRDNCIKMNQRWFSYYGHGWPKFEEQIKLAHRMAKEHGVDLATFSPETMGLTDLKCVDDVLCASESVLKELGARIRKSQELGLRHLDSAKKKSWAKTLDRVLKVRRWCRSPVPPGVHKRKNKEVWEALHPIRYMLWTMRSTLLSKNSEPEVVLVPDHLVMMALVISLARKHRVKARIEGALVQVPPGHFKTWYSIADRALQLNLNPNRPAAILHYVKDHAAERYRAVAEHFDDDAEIGRRRAALFPEIRRWKGSRSEKRFWLTKNGVRTCGEFQEGALTFYGVHSRAQGVGMLELTIDDPSDQKESDQVGTREETNRAMSETWMNRLRGKESFWVYICTAWHPQDFASKLKDMAAKGEVNIAYLSFACGGPTENFKPICPEICDERKLRTQYARLGSARYACVYQNNPDSEEARRLARLHFYDWEMWRDPSKRDDAWRRFFDANETEYWTSVDPSGTEHKDSNLAGAMQAAFGRLRTEDEELGGEVDVPKLVFTEFESLHASQINLAQKLSDMKDRLESPPDRHEMHRWLIESTGGYHATSEFLEDKHKLPASKITRKPPGAGTKLAKFIKYAAIHCENGDVLFPGVWTTDEYGDRALTIHPEWEDVVVQLMQAGSVRESNLLDCVRQMCQEVGHRISRERERIMEMKGGGSGRNDYLDRKREMFRKALRPKNPRTHLPKNLGMLKRSVA
jgi:hypothetical protein